MSHIEKERKTTKILGAGCYVDTIGDLSDLFDHLRNDTTNNAPKKTLPFQERVRKALLSALPEDSLLDVPCLFLTTVEDVAESINLEATALGLQLSIDLDNQNIFSAISRAKAVLEKDEYSRVLIASSGFYQNHQFLVVVLLSNEVGYLGELIYSGNNFDASAFSKRPGLVILENGLEENLALQLPADGLFSGVSIFAPDSEDSIAVELLKLILCLSTKTMLAGLSSNNRKHSSLYCLENERPWLEPTAMVGSKKRRGALVTSQGQIVIEESGPEVWNSSGSAAYFSPIPINQETEIFLLRGESKASLEGMVEELIALLDATSEEETSLRDLAYRVNCTEPLSDKHLFRAAMVASNRIDLQKKSESLRESLSKNTPTRKDVYYTDPKARIKGKLAFMLPGLGSAYQGMLADLHISFPVVNLIMDNLDYLSWQMDKDQAKLPSQIIYPFENQNTYSTIASNTRLLTADFAVAAILHAEYALDAILKDINIEPDAYLGMSTGEYGNYFLNGYARVEYVMIEFYRFIVEFARSIPEDKFSSLKTVSIFGTLASVKDLFAAMPNLGQELHMVGELAMEHVMVTGTKNAVENLIEIAETRGIASLMMPAPIPYHTPLVEDLLDSDQAEIFKSSKTFSRVEVPSWSCALEGPAPEEKNAIEYLAANLFCMPIKLYRTALQMYDSGIRQFVEIGPGSILTTKVNEILKDKPVVAVSSNIQGISGVTQLNRLIASLFIQGRNPDLQKSYFRRGCRRIMLQTPPQTGFELGRVEEFYLAALKEVQSAVDRASKEVFEQYSLSSQSVSNSNTVFSSGVSRPSEPIIAVWVDEADFDLEENAIIRCLQSHFTSKEQNIYDGAFSDEARKRSWFMGRLAAKRAVGIVLEEDLGQTVPAGNIEIENDENGVPWGKVYIENDSVFIRIPISISHSSGQSRIACCLAVTGKDNQYFTIGVDVEELRTMDSGMDDLIFSESEKRLFSSADENIRDKLFLKLWTAKESAYKALGGKSIKAYEALELDDEQGHVTLLYGDRRITVMTGERNGHIYAYTLLKN